MMHQFSVMMFSFRLVPTLFYFSHIVKAAAAVPPALTDTPQLLQLPTLQQPNTTSFAKPNNTSSNILIDWHIHRTSYDIRLIAFPPFQPTLSLASLEEVYTLAIQRCLIKIAQGFGDSPSMSERFTVQDVRLDWVIPGVSIALNNSMLLQVFKELLNINVLQTSPLPLLIGKDLSFTVVDRTRELGMGEGTIVSIREADSEILAKRSVDPSPAPELLQPLASQQPSTTASLSSSTTGQEPVFDYPIPSTPYTIVIHTYSLWSLLELEILEMLYNRALTDVRDKIAEGRGSITPPLFGSYKAPIKLAWRADLFWGGLNYSMLSIAFEALKQLHTDPAPRFRGIHRKMIYYDILEQRGAQRVEVGNGQVERSEAISKRRSVDPLQEKYGYRIDSTPYMLLIAANSGPTIPVIPLWEIYTRIISCITTEIAEGYGAIKPVGLDDREPPASLVWRRSNDGTGLNYRDLLVVFRALSFHHTDLATPWYKKSIRYHVVVQNEGQGPVVIGGGSVGTMLEIGSSNVSVQISKRNSVTPVNPLPSYVYRLPNTPYILNIKAATPAIAPQLPLNSLSIVYDRALHRIAGQIADGHGGDVPAAINVQIGAISLDWRREHPPGLNYTILLRVYSLLEIIQMTEATPFREGYRKSLFLGVKTISGEMIGLGQVSG